MVVGAVVDEHLAETALSLFAPDEQRGVSQLQQGAVLQDERAWFAAAATHE